MSRGGRYLLFLFFCMAAVFSLDAYPFVSGISKETSVSEIVLSVAGTFGILIGVAFSENFKKFIKSSAFMKGDAPAPAAPYSEKNPPMKQEEMKKGEDPAGDDDNGLDAVLDGLKKAITDGNVDMSEESIRGWCGENGVKDEDCDYIVSMLLEPAENVQKAEGQPEKSDALIEGTHDEPDGDEFEKSLMKVFRNMESRIVSTEKKMSSFQKSTRDSIAAKDKEIQFLKSELAKYSKEPVNQKTPAKDFSSSGAGSMQKSRPEIISQIKKGMTLNICGLDDLLAFESKGKLPERFFQIPNN